MLNRHTLGGRSTSHICYIGIIPIGCSLPAYLCDGISLKNRTNLTLETHMLLPIPWFTFYASKLHLSNLLVYLLLSKPTIMTINHHKSANGCSPCRVSAIFCIGITHALATLGFPTRPHWGDSNTCLALLGLSDLTICTRNSICSLDRVKISCWGKKSRPSPATTDHLSLKVQNSKG